MAFGHDFKRMAPVPVESAQTPTPVVPFSTSTSTSSSTLPRPAKAIKLQSSGRRPFSITLPAPFIKTQPSDLFVADQTPRSRSVQFLPEDEKLEGKAPSLPRTPYPESHFESRRLHDYFATRDTSMTIGE